jgi:hypothetical protein
MAQGDIVFYNTAKKHLSDSPINWDTDTIKCELMAAAYTPNIDTDEFWSNISANVAANANYVAKTLTCTTPTVDTALDYAKYDSTTNPTWTALGAGDLACAVIYKDTGNPATSPLICYMSIVATQPNGGDYTITWNTVGIFVVA